MMSATTETTVETVGNMLFDELDTALGRSRYARRPEPVDAGTTSDPCTRAKAVLASRFRQHERGSSL